MKGTKKGKEETKSLKKETTVIVKEESMTDTHEVFDKTLHRMWKESLRY